MVLWVERKEEKEKEREEEKGVHAVELQIGLPCATLLTLTTYSDWVPSVQHTCLVYLHILLLCLCLHSLPTMEGGHHMPYTC